MSPGFEAIPHSVVERTRDRLAREEPRVAEPRRSFVGLGVGRHDAVVVAARARERRCGDAKASEPKPTGECAAHSFA